MHEGVGPVVAGSGDPPLGVAERPRDAQRAVVVVPGRRDRARAPSAPNASASTARRIALPSPRPRADATRERRVSTVRRVAKSLPSSSCSPSSWPSRRTREEQPPRRPVTRCRDCASTPGAARRHGRSPRRCRTSWHWGRARGRPGRAASSSPPRSAAPARGQPYAAAGRAAGHHRLVGRRSVMAGIMAPKDMTRHRVDAPLL